MKRSRWLLLAITAVLLFGVIAAVPAAAKVVTFGNQPADAQKGLTITSTKFDANVGGIDGPLVTVTAPQNARVTVSITGSTAALQTVRADGNGLATFDNLKISTPGTYTLTATVTGAEPSDPSSSFRIFDSVDTCSGEACDAPTGNLKNNNIIADVTGTSSGGGLIATSLNIESAPTCPGDGPQFNHIPGVVSAYWTNIDGLITVTLTVSKEFDQTQSNNGVSFYQVCFTYDIAGKTFTDRFGNTGVTTGLLPDCGPKQGPPCVLSRNKTNGKPIITLRIPEDMRLH